MHCVSAVHYAQILNRHCLCIGHTQSIRLHAGVVVPVDSSEYSSKCTTANDALQVQLIEVYHHARSIKEADKICIGLPASSCQPAVQQCACYNSYKAIRQFVSVTCTAHSDGQRYTETVLRYLH
jgi:hypothetical protein